jgi:translation initiation factor 2B subunit (eIF-2B alpha/beta/delta family)
MQINNKTAVLDNTAERNDNFIDNKWGNQLSDYKNYVKEYIKHYKKAQKGNEVSLAIYPYMKVKWEALNDRLTDATKKNLLTEKQIKKIIKIQSKIVNTCAE